MEIQSNWLQFTTRNFMNYGKCGVTKNNVVFREVKKKLRHKVPTCNPGEISSEFVRNYSSTVQHNQAWQSSVSQTSQIFKLRSCWLNASTAYCSGTCDTCVLFKYSNTYLSHYADNYVQLYCILRDMGFSRRWLWRILYQNFTDVSEGRMAPSSGSKRRWTSTTLHRATSQKTVFFSCISIIKLSNKRRFVQTIPNAETCSATNCLSHPTTLPTDM
jgi:hypothetical protein